MWSRATGGRSASIRACGKWCLSRFAAVDSQQLSRAKKPLPQCSACFSGLTEVLRKGYDASGESGVNYSSVAMTPSVFPSRKFCSVCGYFGFFKCPRYGKKEEERERERRICFQSPSCELLPSEGAVAAGSPPPQQRRSDALDPSSSFSSDARRCGMRYCRKRCQETHKETRCLKFGT
eukprot:scaffold189_cov249-Pinguiococcus_pyrenoidosus.AAC.9